MFSGLRTTVVRTGRSFHSSTHLEAKVAVLGATGGIGQPLSLLCKLSPHVDELSCYDVVGTPGVAADLSHCPSRAKVTGNLPSATAWPAVDNNGLKTALTGADLVVIPAGVPRKVISLLSSAHLPYLFLTSPHPNTSQHHHKSQITLFFTFFHFFQPGMTRDDLFNTNAGIVKTLVEGCAKFCPTAVIAIVSNPVNSTVPIAAEVLKKHGVYDPTKLCGVTTLDICRANTFVAESQGGNPLETNVTVIGGHAGITILPLLSQVEGATFTDEQRDALTHRIQFGGDEVVQAKAGAGSATLSMAYAAYLFTENVLKAMKGEEGIVQCAYVESDVTDAEFFASPVTFGKNGIEKVHGFGALSAYEQGWFDKMLPDLKKQIAKGKEFAA